MGFFARLWSSLFGVFKNISPVLLPVLQSSAGPLINIALPIALGIVENLASGNYSSAAKREFAFTQLKDALLSQGKVDASDLATSTLNLVIEMAVAKLKVS